MLARFRRVRRRRLTLTTHPSHRSAERVASTTPPVPLFFRRRIECVGRKFNSRRRLGTPTSYRKTIHTCLADTTADTLALRTFILSRRSTLPSRTPRTFRHY